jgi:hypothetical protein
MELLPSNNDSNIPAGLRCYPFAGDAYWGNPNEFKFLVSLDPFKARTPVGDLVPSSVGLAQYAD